MMMPHSLPQGSEKFDAITIMQTLAPKGKIYTVIHRFPGHVRLRLHAVQRGELCRFDQVINDSLWVRLVNELPYEKDKLTYYAFERTDGTDSSGFGWPLDSRTNLYLATIYTLATLVHQDRNAWTPINL